MQEGDLARRPLAGSEGNQGAPFDLDTLQIVHLSLYMLLDVFNADWRMQENGHMDPMVCLIVPNFTMRGYTGNFRSPI